MSLREQAEQAADAVRAENSRRARAAAEARRSETLDADADEVTDETIGGERVSVATVDGLRFVRTGGGTYGDGRKHWYVKLVRRCDDCVSAQEIYPSYPSAASGRTETDHDLAIRRLGEVLARDPRPWEKHACAEQELRAVAYAVKTAARELGWSPAQVLAKTRDIVNLT